MFGSRHISDDLTLSGGELNISDNIIQLATGNTTSDTTDIGFLASYYDSGLKYCGIIRDATDSTWKNVNGLTSLPNNGVVDFSTATYNPYSTSDLRLYNSSDVSKYTDLTTDSNGNLNMTAVGYQFKIKNLDGSGQITQLLHESPGGTGTLNTYSFNGGNSGINSVGEMRFGTNSAVASTNVAMLIDTAQKVNIGGAVGVASGKRLEIVDATDAQLRLSSNVSTNYTDIECEATTGNFSIRPLIAGSSIAMGYNSGITAQGIQSVAIGGESGTSSQGANCVAVGYASGQSTQGQLSVAIGYAASQFYQGDNAVSIGNSAGYSRQSSSAVSVGSSAGSYYQGTSSVAVGILSGSLYQGASSVALGRYAGYVSQGTESLSAGNEAGKMVQGAYSVALGSFAGYTFTPIVIDGTNDAISFHGNGVFSTYNTTVGLPQATYNTPFDLFTALITRMNQGIHGMTFSLSWSGVYPVITSTHIFRFRTYGGSCHATLGMPEEDTEEISKTGTVSMVGQGAYAVAVGNNAGYQKQGSVSVAMGYNAGRYNQKTEATALGAGAGQNDQQIGATAVGYTAGEVSQQPYATAVGYSSGKTTQGQFASAFGYQAGFSNQSIYATAMGVNAGYNDQGESSVAVGFGSGQYAQGDYSISTGFTSGQYSQGASSVALGAYSGNYAQGGSAVAIGPSAGKYTQGTYAVGVGTSAGIHAQGDYSISMGTNCGYEFQGDSAVAIGNACGFQGVAITISASNNVVNFTDLNDTYNTTLTNDTYYSKVALLTELKTKMETANLGGITFTLSYSTSNTITITPSSGNLTFNTVGSSCYTDLKITTLDTPSASITTGVWYGQGAYTVAIGSSAGFSNQNDYAVAMGYNAGSYNQNQQAVAIGREAGNANQLTGAVAIGYLSGNSGQGIGAVAMGQISGRTTQGNYAVALGYNAGNSNQGINAVAIGVHAGETNQHNGSIIINAGGSALNSSTTSQCLISPIRAITSVAGNSLMYSSAGELISNSSITYDTSGLTALTFGSSNGSGSLDYYAEGSFTPILYGNGNSNEFTHAIQVGQYTRIGNLVNVYIAYSWTSKNSATGDVLLSNLPFTAVSTSYATFNLTLSWGNVDCGSDRVIIQNGWNFGVFTDSSDDITANTEAVFANSGSIRITGLYWV